MEELESLINEGKELLKLYKDDFSDGFCIPSSCSDEVRYSKWSTKVILFINNKTTVKTNVPHIYKQIEDNIDGRYMENTKDVVSNLEAIKDNFDDLKIKTRKRMNRMRRYDE